MTGCEQFEEFLALYLEGDLPGTEAERVETHLAACPDCRVFADQLRQSQAALKSLGDEEIAPAALLSVRSRVTERINRPKRFAYWVWAPAAAACAVLLVISFYPREKRLAIPAPTVVAEATQAGMPVLQAGRGPAPLRKRVRAKRTTQARMPVLQPLVVKMLTDDPDVVIYWITEPNGE